ncbi:multidrug effflux MFS transporter [Sneathiella sp. P13V-1]|uniref:multidrug effflux MFS transporter n=1 Tax=Sneathiella sp. P13V-1 TaxID=2697366 RepID=UPI001D106DE7|nr:multidrug effflux MFS transporter [Sneathiella sp. P13V-1]
MSQQNSTPRMGRVEQVILLALLSSLIALSIDSMLPALAHIVMDLNVVDPNGRQYVVGATFVGMAFGMFIYGPISDSLGRKRPIYAGILIFLTGCLLSIFAENYTLMLLGRFLQGLGAASPRVVSIALIRDQYSGREMARFTSLVMTVFILVPVLAPALGQIILLFASWRYIFVAMFTLGVIALFWLALRQKETLVHEKRVPFTVNRLLEAVIEVLKTPISFGYTILSGFVFAAFLSFLTQSQQIFQEQYGVGELFPIYFGSLALAFGGASFTNSSLVMKLGMMNLIKKALWVFTILSVLFLGYAFATEGQPSLWLLMAFLLLIFFCVGILFGNINAQAMEPLGHIAGVASAVITSGSTFMSVILGTIVAQSYDGTVLPLVIGFSSFGLLSLMVLYFTNSRHVEVQNAS